MTKYLAALFAALTISVVAVAAEPPATLTLQAKPGNVTFPHKAHADKLGKCETCHATAAGGKIEGFGKDKAHGLCIECHKKEAKGPTKCAECHKKA
ncbi:cytochrome c3 [Anaeromyxobacter sp. K]|uniref:Cytochrome c3 n=1 Tax=Anaeromyxobacter dehalogenans (strain ATCC BAA-258 / DSM 21875 / 2CP-1) TaxID=455488 RepID=B8JA68_ANAD2|nr:MULTISPECIES: cytochrome c3 family protein [Anaeromyxobacter]ACG73386.1 cytochrome c3 [Anaeromyxobacter sp. K]ACL65587.1 cytochrome c3 [Anaeromyxobacter dehalogenans 2CP-1]